MSDPALKIPEIVAAIGQCHGKVALAAQRLGMSSRELTALAESHPEIKDAIEEPQARHRETVELQFERAVLAGEPWAIKEASRRNTSAPTFEPRGENMEPPEIPSGKLTLEQRTLLVGWSAEGLDLWEINERAAKCDPPFRVEYLQLKHVRKQAKKKYSQLKEEFEREALNEGLARRAVRLRAKMERHSLLKQVISERGKADYMQDVAGGKTGLLVREYKGHSDLPVYKLDAALLKEMRDLEREIAIELGQWTEKKELTGAGGEPLFDPLVAALVKAYGNDKQQPAQTD